MFEQNIIIALNNRNRRVSNITHHFLVLQEYAIFSGKRRISIGSSVIRKKSWILRKSNNLLSGRKNRGYGLVKAVDSTSRLSRTSDLPADLSELSTGEDRCIKSDAAIMPVHFVKFDFILHFSIFHSRTDIIYDTYETTFDCNWRRQCEYLWN